MILAVAKPLGVLTSWACTALLSAFYVNRPLLDRVEDSS